MTITPAPRFPGADGGQRSIPSSDTDGAKMEGRHSAAPERAIGSVQSEQAATNSHSPASSPQGLADMADTRSLPPVSASNSSEAA